MPSSSSRVKSLACQQCRKRKRKCNGALPCSNCIKWNTKCEPIKTDNRGFKYTSNYVKSLERENKSMSNILEILKNSNESKRSEILLNINLNRISEAYNNNNISPSIRSTTQLNNTISIKNDIKFNMNINTTNAIQVHAVNESSQNGEPAIYGPSSVYIPQRINSHVLNNEDTSLDFECFHQKRFIDLIETFFVWRYPDVTMFIHRESFLTDFYKSKDDIKLSFTYCSEELIYALCCLGSFNYENDTTSNCLESADHFYYLSRNLIFDKLKNDSYLGLVTIQALLTLSIYDLGRGNNVSAWLLSGIAIRLAEHKGLSHEPLDWKSDSETTLSDHDIGVRSRIFWGCYLTEHFIANVLGRMSIINSKQTTIRETEDLPRLEGIEQFCYKDPLNENCDVRIDISLHLNTLSDIYRICEKFKVLIFSKNETNKAGISNSMKNLQEFTNSMFLWKKKLPENLQWEMKTLESEGHNQILMNIRNQYFLALLSFHRPFINIFLSESNVPNISFEICMDIITQIDVSIRSFLKVQDVRKCSLVTVYNVILAIMIIMSKSTVSEELNVGNNLEILNFFVNLLKDMSFSWKIAGIYYNSIVNTYSSFIKENNLKKNMPMTISKVRSDTRVTQNSQLMNFSEFSVNFENDLFSNEDVSNIFNSILGEMPHFEESGFFDFDLPTDV